MTHQAQAQPVAARVWLWILGAVLAVAGLAFLVGGAKLISLGGSWYRPAGLRLADRSPPPQRSMAVPADLCGDRGLGAGEVGLDYWSLISACWR
jgi:quinate dehydrogenase (quinone)